jgi:hypothetical protein
MMNFLLMVLAFALVVHGPKLVALAWARRPHLSPPAVAAIAGVCVCVALLVSCAGVGYVIGAGKLPSIAWPTWPTITTPDVPVPVKPSRIAIFYESEKGELPGYVSGQEGAIGKLRAQGILVWYGDIDIQDGTNEVPDWAKPAIEEARKKVAESGSALVVFKGTTATIKSMPTTLEAILLSVNGQ